MLTLSLSQVKNVTQIDLQEKDHNLGEFSLLYPKRQVLVQQGLAMYAQSTLNVYSKITI